MDLSWPKGTAVNTAIHKFCYLDTYFTLQYPSVDHIFEAVKIKPRFTIVKGGN